MTTVQRIERREDIGAYQRWWLWMSGVFIILSGLGCSSQSSEISLENCKKWMDPVTYRTEEIYKSKGCYRVGNDIHVKW